MYYISVSYYDHLIEEETKDMICQVLGELGFEPRFPLDLEPFHLHCGC